MDGPESISYPPWQFNPDGDWHPFPKRKGLWDENVVKSHIQSPRLEGAACHNLCVVLQVVVVQCSRIQWALVQFCWLKALSKSYQSRLTSPNNHASSKWDSTARGLWTRQCHLCCLSGEFRSGRANGEFQWSNSSWTLFCVSIALHCICNSTAQQLNISFVFII